MRVDKWFCWPPYLRVGAHVSLDEDALTVGLDLNPLFSLGLEFYYRGFLRGVAADLSLLGFFVEVDCTSDEYGDGVEVPLKEDD